MTHYDEQLYENMTLSQESIAYGNAMRNRKCRLRRKAKNREFYLQSQLINN